MRYVARYVAMKHATVFMPLPISFYIKTHITCQELWAMLVLKTTVGYNHPFVPLDRWLFYGVSYLAKISGG